MHGFPLTRDGAQMLEHFPPKAKPPSSKACALSPNWYTCMFIYALPERGNREQKMDTFARQCQTAKHLATLGVQCAVAEEGYRLMRIPWGSLAGIKMSAQKSVKLAYNERNNQFVIPKCSSTWLQLQKITNKTKSTNASLQPTSRANSTNGAAMFEKHD